MLIWVHDGNLVTRVKVLAAFKRTRFGEHALREALKLDATGNVATDADISYINFSAAFDGVEDQFLVLAAEGKLR